MGSIQNHSLGTDNIAQGSYYDIAWSNSACFDRRVISKKYWKYIVFNKIIECFSHGF